MIDVGRGLRGEDLSVIEAEKEKARWTYKKDKKLSASSVFPFELGLAIDDESRDGNMPARAMQWSF